MAPSTGPAWLVAGRFQAALFAGSGFPQTGAPLRAGKAKARLTSQTRLATRQRRDAPEDIAPQHSKLRRRCGRHQGGWNAHRCAQSLSTVRRMIAAGSSR